MSGKFSWHATLQNFAGASLRAIYRPILQKDAHVNAPVIYAANHTAVMDGPLLLAAIDEPVHVLTKFEVFAGIAGSILRAGGAVPIYWHGADKAALDHAVTKIRSGESVALFPEGSRCTGQYEWIRSGIAYLVAKTGAPVVPIAVLGTRHTGQSKTYITRPYQQTAVLIGEPIAASEFIADVQQPPTRRDLDVISERIRLRLVEFTTQAEQRVGIQLPTDDVSKTSED